MGPDWILKKLIVALGFLVWTGGLFAQSPGLQVTANFAGRTLAHPKEPIEILLSRALDSSEGRVAVFLGAADISGIMLRTDTGLRYAPLIIPLPVGLSEVVVYQVSSDEDWRELARLPLEVAMPAASEVHAHSSTATVRASSPAAPVTSKARAVQLRPTVTVGTKSQAAESHFPESNRPQRDVFADATLQGRLQNKLTYRGLSVQNDFQVIGTSFQKEALRFSQRGDASPKVDLSSYLMGFQVGKTKFQIGQIVYGESRHLIQGFASRGIVANLPVLPFVDLTLAAMNGSSIVGWNNFFGLSERKHRIVTGTVGVELLPKRLGGLRLETSFLYGAVLPIGGFTQGVINDAERNRGANVQLTGSDRKQRLRFDFGLTRSRFTNPSDPLLEQGTTTVSVSETARNARYLDASIDLLRDKAITKRVSASLSATYRHERVDPLYRSVSAFTQADRLQNIYELTGRLGQLNVSASHLRSNNNLLEVPSIMETLTRQNQFILGIPLSQAFRDSSKPVLWLPMLSYSFQRGRQFGDSFPASGFLNLSQVPDQMSMNQSANLDWQFGRLRAAYRFNHSFQDNRQPGRESSDFGNGVHGFSLGGTVSSGLDLHYEQSVEGSRNFEFDRRDRLHRSSIQINSRMTQKITLNATLTGMLGGNLDNSSKSRSGEIDVQCSYQFGYDRGEYKKIQGQFFARYSSRYGRTFDGIFGFGNLTRLNTLSLGLNFTFF